MNKNKLLFFLLLLISLLTITTFNSNAYSYSYISSLGYRNALFSDNGKIFGEDLSTDVYVNTDVDLYLDNSTFPEALEDQPPTEVDKLFNFSFSWLGNEYNAIHFVRTYSSGLGGELIKVYFYNTYSSDLSDMIYYGATEDIRTTPDGVYVPATADFVDDSRLVFSTGEDFVISSSSAQPNNFLLSSWCVKDINLPSYTLSLGQIENPIIDINSNANLVKYSLNYSNSFVNINTEVDLPFVLYNINSICFKNDSTNYKLYIYKNNSPTPIYIVNPNNISDWVVLSDYTIIQLAFYNDSSGSTDEDIVNMDLDSLILGGEVIGSFNPPLIGENGSTFTYQIQSGALDYVSYNSSLNEVIIKRPKLGDTPKKFVLRATAKFGNATNYRDFEYTILPEFARDYKVLPNWYYFNSTPNFTDLNSIYQKIFNFVYNGEIYNFISSRSTTEETNLPNTFALTYNYYDTELESYKLSIDVATYTYNSITNTFDNFEWINNSYRQIYFGSNRSVKISEYDWFVKNGIFEYIQEVENSEFVDLFYGLVDSQVYYIKSLLSWELFGVNLYSAFTSILTLAFIVFMIRKIL